MTSFHEYAQNLDVITLRDLDVLCVVGLYPREKNTPQPLVLQLKLYLDTRRAVRENSLRHTVDYAALAGEIRFVLQHARYRLLETAADALASYLLAPSAPEATRASIQAVDLTIEKPHALPGRTVASVRVRRKVGDYTSQLLVESPEHVEVLHQHEDCTLFRMTLLPQTQTQAFTQPQGVMAEMPLGSGVMCNTRPAPAGAGHIWQPGETRSYTNSSTEIRTLLGVSRAALQHLVWHAAGTVVPEPTILHYYPSANDIQGLV